MAFAVHFSAELASWLVRNLDEGRAPASLVETMIVEQMPLPIARAILDAFLTARREGRPAPTSGVTLDERAIDYVYERPILRPDARLSTFDRTVRVLLRVDEPVIAVLGGVLSRDECAEVIRLARPRLAPSTVVDPKTGYDVIAGHRTSLGMFFRPAETPLIERLDRRVAELMNLPLENGEGFQVLHYPAGAECTPHFDFLIASNVANHASIARSGQRVSTLIAYLYEVESGGETVFPKAGVRVTPECGNAVYFEYENGLGQVDERSLHAGAVGDARREVGAHQGMRRRPFVSKGVPIQVPGDPPPQRQSR